MTPLEFWSLFAAAIVAVLALAYGIGWGLTDCPRWFLRCTCRRTPPPYLPGPESLPAPRAGEFQWDFTHEDVLAAVPDVERWLEADEFDQLDPDQAADQLIAEWHAPDHELTAEDWIARDLADLELLAWDAKQQAARCWEILHVEFPRLRAELGIAA